MHQSSRRLLLILVILMLLVGVVCSCCSCAIPTNASTIIAEDLRVKNRYVCDAKYGGVDDCKKVLSEISANWYESDVDYTTLKGYSNFLDETFSSTVITRRDWLKDLIPALGLNLCYGDNGECDNFFDKDYFDSSEYFITAVKNDILGGFSGEFDPYCAVTRQYVSTTLVNGVGYDLSCALNCSDYRYVEDKHQVAVALYLGYFDTDENNCFNPYDDVTQEQVESIVSELGMIDKLKGYTVMSFGDSIMHGDGNEFVGIADLMAQKYKMTAIDYSKGGSTFGEVSDRQQISNQILNAIDNGEMADIILINGGTNDMRKVKPGVVSEDFDYVNHGRLDFCSGMEYAFGLLKDYYSDTPVIYVRAHNMEYGIERNELHFGTLALDICDKWEVESADIYNLSGFDGHNDDMRSVYTVHTKRFPNGDSIHPNRLGYYKYYIPTVSKKTAQLLGK